MGKFFDYIIKKSGGNMLLILLFVSVTVGFSVGYLLRPYNLSSETIMLISFPGEILMRMLKMLVLPLIITSIVTGVAVLDPKSSGKIGLYSVSYYLCTSVMAAILGIFLVINIKPGNPELLQKLGGDGTTKGIAITTQDAALDLIRNIFPENIVQAAIQQGQTHYTYEDKYLNSSSNSSMIGKKKVWNFKYNDNMNIIGVIFFCIALGMVISNMGRKAEILLHLFLVLNEIIMKLMKYVMWYSPIGIVFLVSGKILEIDDVSATVQKLGYYMLTVTLGLNIHCFIILPLGYLIICRKNPFKVYYGCLQAILTGLATSSSSATLPVTFRCLEENVGIDSRITRFVLPIGSTINMDGTALYEAIAPIFIAQVNDIPLSPIQYIIISLTATIASIGAASIPSAGLVTMVIVLQSVGLPVKDISLILAVDFILDRMRTIVNILGDSLGACIVDHLSKKDLEKLASIHEEDFET